MIQVKVLYGQNRCKVKTFYNNEDLYEMSFNSFKNDIKGFVGGVFLVSNQVRIEYRDDEGTFVTMTENSDLQDALRCLSAVPNTDDSFRMVIKIDESMTPGAFEKSNSVNSPEKKKCRTVGTAISSSKGASSTAFPPLRKKLSFEKDTSCKQNKILEALPLHNESDDDSDSIDDELDQEPGSSNDTPIDRYIRKTEQKIEEHNVAIEKLKQGERSVRRRIETAKSNNRNAGSLCSGCHLRLGHTIRTCIFERCSSVFQCGEEKQHPGEINSKKTKLAIARLESAKKKLETELQNKKEAKQSVRSSIVNRLEDEIMSVDKDSYVSNGVKNWGLLRKHVFVLQAYCKKHLNSRIPPKHKLMSCLHEALGEEAETASMTMSQVKRRSSRENPFKGYLEKQGIVFPSSSESRSSKEKASEVYRSAPLTELEEEEQLQMVLSISAGNTFAETPVSESYGPWCCDTSVIDDLMEPHPSQHPVNFISGKEKKQDSGDDTEVANLLLSLNSNLNKTLQ